jgi:aquaporin NIP
MRVPRFRRIVAEATGTFALVFAGCGAVMVDHQTSALTHVGVALVFGLVITVMISATGHLSEAHFNPAVTIAFALTRHFPWRETVGYIGGQFTGAYLYQFIRHDDAR